jgi:hypothetical protein
VQGFSAPSTEQVAALSGSFVPQLMETVPSLTVEWVTFSALSVGPVLSSKTANATFGNGMTGLLSLSRHVLPAGIPWHCCQRTNFQWPAGDVWGVAVSMTLVPSATDGHPVVTLLGLSTAKHAGVLAIVPEPWMNGTGCTVAEAAVALMPERTALARSATQTLRMFPTVRDGLARAVLCSATFV